MNTKHLYTGSILNPSEEWKRRRQIWRLVVALLTVLIIVSSSISIACIFCLWNDVYRMQHNQHSGSANADPPSVLNVQLAEAHTPLKIFDQVDAIVTSIEPIIFNGPFDGLSRYDRLMAVDLRGVDLPTVCRTYPRTEIPILEALLGFAHPRCSKVVSELRDSVNRAQNIYKDSGEGDDAPVDLVYLAVPYEDYSLWMGDLKSQLRRDGWTMVTTVSDLGLGGQIDLELLPEIQEMIVERAQVIVDMELN